MMFNTNYRPGFVLLLFFFAAFQMLGQEVQVLKQNLNSNGSSAHFSSGNKNYIVQQSVGQASVIGFGESDRLKAFQGFFSPYPTLKAPSAQSQELRLSAFPNPFQDRLNLRFEEDVDQPVSLELRDLNGRVVFKQSQTPATNMSFLLPSHLENGAYLLLISSAQKSYTSMFIKTTSP
jgi:hypothetical protein